MLLHSELSKEQSSGQALCQANQVNQIASPSGVSSALRDLLAEVEENRNRTENLRSVLGISFPSQESKSKAPSTSLRDLLVDAAAELRYANTNLGMCLEHLNS